MLISLSHHFIFIANTKTASTTVEAVLRDHAEITLVRPRYGKHMSYREVQNKFLFLLKRGQLGPSDFFRFGVVREPLDWVVSWYNYRSRMEIADASHPSAKRSCQNIEFEAFAKEVLKPKGQRKPYAAIGKQHGYFTNAKGEVIVDYLIALENINEDIQSLCRAMDIPVKAKIFKKKRNVSPKRISSSEVDPGLAQELRAQFAADSALYARAREREYGAIEDVIRSKLSV